MRAFVRMKNHDPTAVWPGVVRNNSVSSPESCPNYFPAQNSFSGTRRQASAEDRAGRAPEKGNTHRGEPAGVVKKSNLEIRRKLGEA